MRQIADRLEISHTTVSRALKDDPRISESLRARIREVAEEMGYTPDPMLAALSLYRRSNSERPITAALAWVNCWPTPSKLRTFKEFDLYWKGAAEEARRSGYRLDEFNCPAELPPNRLHEILRARGIQGLLLTPSWSNTTPDWSRLDWNEFSVVRFGYSLQQPESHLVSSDQVSNGVLAFENMWAKGYRRIAMVMWRRQGTRLVRFSAGYLYAQLRLSKQLRIQPLILDEGDPEETRRQLSTGLKQINADAVLTDIPEIPNMLREAGFRVPQDLGVATLSVLDGNADAGIYQNSEEIGAAAVQLLISLLHHNQRGVPEFPREVLVPGRWVDGSTLPPKAV